MNTTTKLSTAIVLGLSLLGMSAAADAASARPVTKAAQVQTGATSYAAGKVIHLGTISVTRDDAEGAKAKAPKATQPKGTLFLGSISVTPADSVDARYAVAQAQQKPGSVFIGSIEVTAKSHRLPVIGTLVAAVDSTRSRNLLAAIGALVFARAGG